MKQLFKIYHLTAAPDSLIHICGIIQNASASSSLRELEKESLILPANPNGYNYC